MKKSFILLLIAVLLNSLVKANSVEASNGLTIVSQKNHIVREAYTQNWSVSTYGFLVFPTVSDLEEYLTFITSKTHGEAQSYLNSISFSSLGATLYGYRDFNNPVSASQATDYVLNTARVLQVEEIVIKPVSQTSCQTVKWQFILAMKPAYVSSSSYDDLVRGVYDANTMNKIATNPPSSDTTSLTRHMTLNPYGYEETTPNPCPTNEAEKRPFWGYGPTSCQFSHTETNPSTGNPYNVYKRCDTGAYYVFWIKVKDAICQTAYSCGAN